MESVGGNDFGKVVNVCFGFKCCGVIFKLLFVGVMFDEDLLFYFIFDYV